MMFLQTNIRRKHPANDMHQKYVLSVVEVWSRICAMLSCRSWSA